MLSPSTLPSRMITFHLTQTTTACRPVPTPLSPGRPSPHSLTILTLFMPPCGATSRRRAHLAPGLLTLNLFPSSTPLTPLLALHHTRTGPGPPLRPRLRPRIRPVHVPQAAPGLDHVAHAALELLCLGEAAVGFAVPEAGGGCCDGGGGVGIGGGGGGGDELDAKDAAEAGLEGDFGEGVGEGGEEFLGVLCGGVRGGW